MVTTPFVPLLRAAIAARLDAACNDCYENPGFLTVSDAERCQGGGLRCEDLEDDPRWFRMKNDVEICWTQELNGYPRCYGFTDCASTGGGGGGGLGGGGECTYSPTDPWCPTSSQSCTWQV